MSDWPGSFYFGDYWAAYRGAAGDNEPHAHATLQITLAHEGAVTLVDAEGKDHSGEALMVRPRVAHKLERQPHVTLFLIEPQTTLCRTLVDAMGTSSVAPPPAHIIEKIDLAAPLHTCLGGLMLSPSQDETAIDPRLQKAIAFLEAGDEDRPLTIVAEACGLSVSRLRALATKELHVPLSKWILWRKLRRSAEELAAGADLASAAFAGGFADQAHFTRTMKKHIGITPGMAAAPLR